VLPEDVLGAAQTGAMPAPLPYAPGEPIKVVWVMTPPGATSGGHTTLFRLIEHLERAGHQCTVALYDAYGSRARHLAASLRSHHPDFGGDVVDSTDGLPDAHAVFATSWQTAYPVAASRSAGARFYLVQDFEPHFYPCGSASSLAEDTYRMGFHGVTAGRWLAETLHADYGMDADAFDFGCDTARYRRDDDAVRDGVVFYARDDAPRRACELGLLALELFARRHPEVTIHLFGGRPGRAPFRHIEHGRIRPDDLDALYNRCAAGLSLSMTNVSLVPFEMMASGCLPVVNDAPHNRIVLDSPHVTYAPPSPRALADALERIVTAPDQDVKSAAAAAWTQSRSWSAAGALLERVLERELGRRAVAPR
jgi:hypothetical protein